jgi:hypothetical protein
MTIVISRTDWSSIDVGIILCLLNNAWVGGLKRSELDDFSMKNDQQINNFATGR